MISAWSVLPDILTGSGRVERRMEARATDGNTGSAATVQLDTASTLKNTYTHSQVYIFKRIYTQRQTHSNTHQRKQIHTYKKHLKTYRHTQKQTQINMNKHKLYNSLAANP